MALAVDEVTATVHCDIPGCSSTVRVASDANELDKTLLLRARGQLDRRGMEHQAGPGSVSPSLSVQLAIADFRPGGCGRTRRVRTV